LVTGLDAYPREIGNIDPLPNNVADVLKPLVPIVMSGLDLHQAVFLKSLRLWASIGRPGIDIGSMTPL
jgi:hypothetical protein